MEKCANCGYDLKKYDKFCRNCGCKKIKNSYYIILDLAIFITIILIICLIALIIASYLIFN